MNAIGGYFGLEPEGKKQAGEYYPNLIALNTGRNALVYLVRARGIRKIWLPRLCCDTVTEVLDREGVDYEFYEIDSSFRPVFSRKLSECEYLYVINYYGQLTDFDCPENCILDNVQAFFQKPKPGTDTIYSCRKMFGVPDGAYLSSDCGRMELKQDCSSGRMRHLYGRANGSAEEYYDDFQKNDESFRTLELMSMSDITRKILSVIDYDEVIHRRNRNFSLLHSLLGNENRLNIHQPEGAFAYPFYCENGIAVRKNLAKKRIYVPTLWPNCISDDYAANILPLPCDQRYGEKEMLYLTEELRNSI